jgi:hypothetical protein
MTGMSRTASAQGRRRARVLLAPENGTPLAMLFSMTKTIEVEAAITALVELHAHAVALRGEDPMAWEHVQELRELLAYFGIGLDSRDALDLARVYRAGVARRSRELLGLPRAPISLPPSRHN